MKNPEIVLDRPLVIQRSFMLITGDIESALFLTQAVFWTGRTSDPEGWFCKTHNEWFEEIALTRREVDRARDILKGFGVLEESLRGMPAKMHFRVRFDVLNGLIEGLTEAEIGRESSEESSQFVRKRQTSLYTKEERSVSPLNGSSSSLLPLLPQSPSSSSSPSVSPSSPLSKREERPRALAVLAAPGKKKKLDTENILQSVSIDLTLRNSSFRTAWLAWIQNRLTLPKPTLGCFEEHMRICARLGEPRAVAAIRHSIALSYLSIFEPKPQPKARETKESRYPGI